MLHLALVAGEASGDLLGAGLLRALRESGLEVRASGIGGPRMAAAGLESLYPMDRLAVMGLFEVLGRYPELLRLRARLARHWLDTPPDLFIGIDAPDFNLGLAERLHAGGVRTVQYVSPQVWAWREGRVETIRRAVDRMLVLFPFEVDYYRRQGVEAVCVGHPLADRIDFDSQPEPAREALGLPPGAGVVGILPGSRRSEIARHLPPFLDTVAWLYQRRPGLRFAVAAVGEAAASAIRAQLAARLEPLPVQVVTGRSHTLMQASDVLLSVSGTATLEGMLYGKPMVVAYRMAWPTWLLVQRMVRVRQCALPNLLAGEALVPEFIQSAVRADTMGAALLHWLDAPAAVEALRERFRVQGGALRRDASRSAAEAVRALLSQAGAPA